MVVSPFRAIRASIRCRNSLVERSSYTEQPVMHLIWDKSEWRKWFWKKVATVYLVCYPIFKSEPVWAGICSSPWGPRSVHQKRLSTNRETDSERDVSPTTHLPDPHRRTTDWVDYQLIRVLIPATPTVFYPTPETWKHTKKVNVFSNRETRPIGTLSEK